MRAQQLPAVAGWHWVARGFAIFRRNPAMLFLLSAFYWVVLLFVNVIPLLGPVLASIAIPALSVGVMNGCRDIARGVAPQPGALFSGFGGERKSLLTLGTLYLALTLGILLLSSAIDGGELMRFLTTGKRPAGDATDNLGTWLAPLVVASLLLPLMMAYWFGPMLAAWYRLPPMKSLFFSLVACCINWRAFMVYGATLFLLGVALPVLCIAVAGLAGEKAIGLASALLTLPLLIVFMPCVFASFYASYQDVFGVSERV